jgi:hypothetical protein
VNEIVKTIHTVRVRSTRSTEYSKNSVVLEYSEYILDLLGVLYSEYHKIVINTEYPVEFFTSLERSTGTALLYIVH